MKNEENTSAPESLPETESANEETDNSTTSKLIEDKTYYFDDAMFTINGIQLTVNSITLHREYKPEGYSLEVAYSKAEVGISIRLDFLFHIHQMLCCRCPFRAFLLSSSTFLLWFFLFLFFSAIFPVNCFCGIIWGETNQKVGER